METVIIDNSLAEMAYLPTAHAYEFVLYSSALLNGGVQYLEIDSRALRFFDGERDKKRYIFRVNSREDLEATRNYDFAYVVVPLKMNELIDEISSPIILETETDGKNALIMMALVSAFVDTDSCAMIRLTGNFDLDGDKVCSMIRNIRMRYFPPLNICAKNDNLTALSASVSAVMAQADALTLTFGGEGNTASLAEFLLVMNKFFNANFPTEKMEYLMRAEGYYANLTGVERDDVFSYIKAYYSGNYPTDNREKSPAEQYASSVGRTFDAEADMNAQGRCCDLDEETAEELFSLMGKREFFAAGLSNFGKGKKKSR